MGFISKLKDIIFDEVTVEIPVITKEDEEAYENKKKNKNTIVSKNDDEVVITKVDTKKDVTSDSMFDMPKLIEEEKKNEEVKHKSNFTFPVFDDDEEDEKVEEIKPRVREVKQPTRTSRGYDYLSSSSLKVDSYTQSRNNLYDKDAKKPFTLSPIISPVYGILNENYKKEDIVAKDSSNLQYKNTTNDLDAVRKKAYGTLEDELEDKLVLSSEDVLDEVPEKKDYTLDTLSDDGLSVSDLLIDDEEEEIKEELFDIGSEEIDVTDNNDNEEIEIDEPKHEEEKIVVPSKEDTEGDDLFDLIDSLYEEKDKEEE